MSKWDERDLEELSYAVSILGSKQDVNSCEIRNRLLSVLGRHALTKPESDKHSFVRRLLDNAGTYQNVDAAHFYLKGYLACMDENGL